MVTNNEDTLVTVIVTTKRSTTTAEFTDRVSALRYALHLAEEGYEVEVREGV